MKYDLENEMFRLASDLVNQSSRNIFLTGKAGTGKTTFLKYIRENCAKQMAVVAPTGVAAINAGGVTIHSFFQLPVSPFIPESGGAQGNDGVSDPHSLVRRLRMNREKITLLQELELLIIDEISMVRCDVLDAVDTVLRHIRNQHYEIFGGVQVLFIGDMFQLPPVIKDEEWSILSRYYASPYFFDSQAMQQEQPLYIEFEKIYRQSDQRFIRLLNQVRNNDLDEDALEILESRYEPEFRYDSRNGFIILSTHNEKARHINSEQLQSLSSRLYTYKADIEGDFPPGAWPAEELLQLKEGTQVMFIKNDPEKAKRYFNGRIGTVTKLEDNKIVVQCKDESTPIEVKKEKWENIRYSFNAVTRKVEQQVLGSFSQYPLRLAWAITIHKSQGLTFEKAIIDAGKSFASGQVYVALSRCTSLEGMVLQSRINMGSLQTDPRIVNFSKTSASPERLQDELAKASETYRQKVLLATFDFAKAINSCNELTDYVRQNASSFNGEAINWLTGLTSQLEGQQGVAVKFQGQLQRLFNSNDHMHLAERVKAASAHFSDNITALLQVIPLSPATTDSRLHAKEYNELLKEIMIELALKKHLLQGKDAIIDLEEYHRRKRSFVAPPLPVNAYAGSAERQSVNVPHPQLHQQLRRLRDSICEKKGIPLYLVAGTQTLQEMATYLPQSLDEMQKISGMGPVKIKSYGQQFLDIILAYSEKNALASAIEDKQSDKTKASGKEPKEPKTPKVNTKAETYRLYKEGLNPAAIAKERNLTVQTIEGHLAYYIEQGEINIEQLVSREKLLRIEPVVKDFEEGSITPLKEQLGDDITYGEIRMVIAWHTFQKQQAIE